MFGSPNMQDIEQFQGQEWHTRNLHCHFPCELEEQILACWIIPVPFLKLHKPSIISRKAQSVAHFQDGQEECKAKDNAKHHREFAGRIRKSKMAACR